MGTQHLACLQFKAMSDDKIERMGTVSNKSLPISIDKEIRNSFTTFKDHTWIGMDWKAAELYYWASKSGDQVMIDDLLSGDIHEKTSINFLNTPKDSLLFPEMREVSKLLVYNAFYCGFDSGIVTSNLCDKLNKKYPELKLKPWKFAESIDKLKERWCVMFEYICDSVMEWRLNGGYVAYGEDKDFRYLEIVPELDIKSLLRNNTVWKVINCQSQNSVALAIKKLITWLPEEAKAVISIYDAIYYQVPTSELEDHKTLLKDLSEIPIRCDNKKSCLYGQYPLSYKPELKEESSTWGGLG